MVSDEIEAARRELEQAEAAIQNAYWIFTRTKRGRPPAAELYERRNAARARLDTLTGALRDRMGDS